MLVILYLYLYAHNLHNVIGFSLDLILTPFFSPVRFPIHCSFHYTCTSTAQIRFKIYLLLVSCIFSLRLTYLSIFLSWSGTHRERKWNVLFLSRCQCIRFTINIHVPNVFNTCTRIRIRIPARAKATAINTSTHVVCTLFVS